MLCSWPDTILFVKTFKWNTMHLYGSMGCKTARGQSWWSEKIAAAPSFYVVKISDLHMHKALFSGLQLWFPWGYLDGSCQPPNILKYYLGKLQHNIHELNWNELPSSEDCVGVIEFFSNFTKNSC